MPEPAGPRTAVLAATADGIAEAARLIGRGETVAFPTETVYGLGADVTDDRAVARIFEAKGRPRFNPLIVHFADRAAALAAGRFDRRAHALAEAFWPGPLTLVVARAPACPVSLLASAGLPTLALRLPAHPVARALIEAAGVPLAAPSANRSSRLSPTAASHVLADLAGRIAAVIDGGPCRIGIESTVVDLSEETARLLRPGAVAAEAIAALIGPLAGPPAGPVRAPGMLERHYAPATPLRLEAADAGPGEVLLGFGANAPADALNLSASGDLVEAAANLFAMLRDLDRRDARAIAVMAIPDRGLGAAINDRLRRAAAPG